MAKNTIKVAISADFLTAFATLPRQIQGKVTEFMNKFRNNPTSPGINYEKLSACRDKKICSVRIDDTYRGIVVREQETGVYLLLWIDHHDEAYEWAKNKKCEVNLKTGAIQIYDITIDPQSIPSEKNFYLFSEISDIDLVELGLPEELIPLARSVSDTQEFYSKKNLFPADVFETLSWIAEGFPLNEVKALIKQEYVPISNNFEDALDNPETLKTFVVVEGEDELRKIMAEPLEKWRVFLHPTQRKIVKKNYSGAARVLGGAGTGKTVVAMHRAKQLATSLRENERILFTTYTANLASDIKENLRKICTLDELRKIDVINLDAWVAQFLREHGFSAEIAYDEKITKIWEDAVAMNDVSSEFPINFYEDEYNRVVVAQEAFSLEKYVKASRIGRGTRLDRKKRMQLWKVFESYLNIMKERQIRDIHTWRY